MKTALACPPPERQHAAAALAARFRAVGLRPVLHTALAAVLIVPILTGLPALTEQQDGGENRDR
jgi:hypothetical protein